MKRRLFRCTIALALAATAYTPLADAQSVADKAAAESLFDQGRAAMQEGDFAKACGLLERSQHIDPGVGTLLYLAECYEKSGRTASAWATFREAADAATAAKEPQRARTGRERAQRLEPLLSRLTIQIAPETQQLSGLTIDRKDKIIQPALFNVAVPTDPGEYTVTASAPGYESWSGTITVPDRAGRVAITVPALRKSSEPDKGATATASPAPGAPAPDNVVPADTQGAAAATMSMSEGASDAHSSAQRTMGLVVGAAGVVGIGLGTYFGLRAFSKNGELEDACKSDPCGAPDGPDLHSAATNAATASNIAFGIGLAALAGGIVLYLTAPPSTSATASHGALHARVAPGSVVLGGSF
jgi:serine/threonine-protein kinase